MEPEPTIQQAFSLVAQEVEQRASVNATSFTANSNNTVSSPATILVKNSYTHVARSQSNSTKEKERSHCTHYNIQGHTMDRCYKIHGYPLGYRNQKNTPSGTSKTEASSSTDSSSLLTPEQ